jgi:hypothetical protein
MTAARLLGAAEALRDELGNRQEGVELALHDAAVAELHQAVAPEELAAAWTAGRAFPPDLIVAEILRLTGDTLAWDSSSKG